MLVSIEILLGTRQHAMIGKHHLHSHLAILDLNNSGISPLHMNFYQFTIPLYEYLIVCSGYPVVLEAIREPGSPEELSVSVLIQSHLTIPHDKNPKNFSGIASDLG